MEDALKMALEGPLDAYKSIPFWSWNSALEIPELLRQIEQMKAEGIGGFIMHARTGLTDEYLGEHWFDCIGACLEKAKELGMEAWIYDENGWPSGFVGGKLLENEDFRARFLEYGVGAFDGDAYAVFVADEALGYRRVDAPVEGAGEYHNVYLRVSPANTDILDPQVVDAFIEETHERYYARFAGSFGREMAGFFTDEPQFYRWATPYTHCAEPYFDDIRDGLIWLFVQDERGYPFRLKYYGTLNELYVENFYKKIYDWCQAHNCKLTGHSVEESCLFAQMWGAAAVMPSYEFEDMPGIDSLGRGNTEELASVQVGSVAAQLGKQFILTETFGCAGYDVTPKELRSIAEAQYFQGVNRMCQHLYPYSMAGQGKTDHPPVFGPQGNWGEGFKTFNDYFTRLGYVIGNTKPVVDVAVLSPVHDIWLNYIRTQDFESVRALEQDFKTLLNVDLRKNGINFHILDERILARHGSIEGNCLRVGEMTYPAVLIPRMENLEGSTYELLKQFTGRLCVLGELKYVDGLRQDVKLAGNMSFEKLVADRHIPYENPDGTCFVTHRKSELGDFLFIKNMFPDRDGIVRLENGEEYSILDLQTLTERPAGKEMTVGVRNSLILLRNHPKKSGRKEETVRDVTGDFRVTGISENYLVLDYAQISKNAVDFGGKYPIVGLVEELLRENYKGEITVRQTFTLAEKMPLTLMMEKAKLTSATLNGQELKFHKSGFDVNFMEAEISDHVRAGENVLCYSFRFWQHDGVHFALFDPMATESLRNCLYYDTTIEPVYLRGDFVVREDLSLAARTELPPVTSRLLTKGYPFFMGTVRLEGNIRWDGRSSVTLGLDGRFTVAELSINGKNAELSLDSKTNISDMLCEGENRVAIVLRSSLRNLFGPHHFKPEAEPMGVTPYCYTMRGSWGEGVSPDYTHVYNSVPFGADRIWLATEA